MKTDPTGKRHADVCPSAPTAGMTLMEVCVGVFLFVMVAAALMSSLVTSRQVAVSALYESSALIAAEGYMEQIKTIPFSLLYDSRKDRRTAPPPGNYTPTNPPPLTAAIVPDTIKTVTATGALDELFPVSDLFPAANQPNNRNIDVFGHYHQQTPPPNAPDLMPMTLTVKVTNLSTGYLDDERLLIELNYTWGVPNTRGIRTTRSGSLALIRSNVRSFVN